MTKASFSNFILKFGEKNLIDYVDSVVLPAFTDKELRRKYGKASYRLYQVAAEPAVIGGFDNFIIYGQLIKDTVLESRQYLGPNEELIVDQRWIQDTPSSFFFLEIAGHKLIFVKETSFAPDEGAFRSTLFSFIKQKRDDMIHQIYLSDDNKLKKKELYAEHPAPSLEILPIISSMSARQFINKYDILKEVNVRFVRPNPDSHPGEWLEAISDSSQEFDSVKTRVQFKNNNGLDKDAATHTLDLASKDKNQYVNLNGTDPQGRQLKGSNESFQLQAPLEIESLNNEQKSKQALAAIDEAINDNEIERKTLPTSRRDVLRRLGLFI